MKFTLGTFIAHLRKEKGLTQKQLAEMLCVSDKTVSHWEREESSPDISLLPIIAEIFEITVDELLKGEKKENISPETKSNETGLLYALDVAYNSFRTKNLISLALSVMAVLCGLIVDYYKTVTGGYLVFLAILIVPLLLTAVFRGNFSSRLISPYIEKNILKDFTCKANRLTANCLYFTLLCFVLYSMKVVIFLSASVFAAFLIFAVFTVLITVCEIFLKKEGFIKPSGKALKIKKTTLLSILSIVICSLLLYAGFFSHSSINSEIIIMEKAEHTVLSPEEFIKLIETPTNAPENIYLPGSTVPDFTPADEGLEVSFYVDFGMDNTIIQPIDPDYDGEITFTYRNLQVASYSYRSDEGFYVYTHNQLIDAEQETRAEIDKLNIIHFSYYAFVVVLTIITYLIIRKRLSHSEKSNEITLIKNF